MFSKLLNERREQKKMIEEKESPKESVALKGFNEFKTTKESSLEFKTKQMGTSGVQH